MGAEPSTPSSRHVVRRRLDVMSCSATIVATFRSDDADRLDTDTVVEGAARRLDELEGRWSRFLPDSEVSRLNAEPTVAQRVSRDTYVLVERLVQAWRSTGGSFDPTLLGTLVHLGYGVSRERSDRRTALAHDTGQRGRPEAIRVDATDGSVLLGVGTSIDPGGIGKGLAADLVVDEIIGAGAIGALVEIGGDVRVRGVPPAGTAWPIAIGDDGEIVLVADGGVATSTTALRTWNDGGRTMHHLIDPVTLECADTDVHTCTVIASTGAWAEAMTKIAFAKGASAAIDHYESRGLAASVTTDAGTLRTSTWEDFRA